MTARNSVSGVGLGLRADHYSYIQEHKPAVPWFEVLIDNYLNKCDIITSHLEHIRCDYPFTFHGVGMSLGSTDPLNYDYLALLRQAIDHYQPELVSDHLCWTGVHQQYAHDLLPLPYTDEALKHVSTRIQQVQDFLQRRILIENVSTYLTWQTADYSEAEFLAEVAEAADCDILLDINNIYVSGFNQQFDPLIYLTRVPKQRIKEFHLAGYEDQGTHLLDTHGDAIHAPVWVLYAHALKIIGTRPTLVEWDNNIPAFTDLLAEANKAQHYLQRHHSHAA